MTAGDERRVRAQGSGTRCRHAGAYAQGSGLVGGGGDDATPRGPPNDDGPPDEAWILAHFDLGEEGVHVDVKDRGG